MDVSGHAVTKLQIWIWILQFNQDPTLYPVFGRAMCWEKVVGAKQVCQSDKNLMPK